MIKVNTFIVVADCLFSPHKRLVGYYPERPLAETHASSAGESGNDADIIESQAYMDDQGNLYSIHDKQPLNQKFEYEVHY